MTFQHGNGASRQGAVPERSHISNALAHTANSQATQRSGWRHMAVFCSAHRDLLNERERGFISSMVRWTGELSEKQEKSLTGLFLRVGGAQ